MINPKEVILNYLKEQTEPQFARQMLIKSPNGELYLDQKVVYYLTRLYKENKIERIFTEGDSYRYKIK